MLKIINNILQSLRKGFSEHGAQAFRLFVIVIVGLILTNEDWGVTSIVRALSLDYTCYESLIHFFNSASFCISDIMQIWTSNIRSFAPIYEVNGRVVLVGDHKKLSKEGKRTPGVKRLKQDSENSAKSNFIFGHCFGCIGLLIGNQTNYKCLPLSMRLHDGLKAIAQWSGKKVHSMVEKVIHDAYRAACSLGSSSYVVLDAFFLSKKALVMREELQSKDSSTKIDIITRARFNSKAYYPLTQEEIEAQKGKRGPRRQKGEDVKLKALFKEREDEFKSAQVCMYGEQKEVRYLSLSLQWGQGLYEHLQFVLTEVDGRQIILVSTDLNLDPITVIHLYSCRFSIEESFKFLNQEFHGFSYRFWSKNLGKLNKFYKSGEKDPLSKITDERCRKLVIRTVERIHRYVNFSCITLGIIEILCFKFQGQINPTSICYMRTYRGDVMLTIGQMKRFLTKNFFILLDQEPELELTKTIQGRQSWLKRLISKKEAA